jgi:hypothetical protein
VYPSAGPLLGSIAETYLDKTRGIDVTRLPEDIHRALRFHPHDHRIDFSRAIERVLGARELILIELPRAEAPERRRIGWIQIDGASHLANRLVAAPQPRVDHGEVERPPCLRGLRGGC